jgi:plastocyanin
MPSRPARRALRPAIVLAAVLVGMVPASADAATVTVRIGQSLSPRTVTIAPGTSVRWVNASDNRYRMRSRNGPVEFDSGNLEPGESYTFTFTRVGTYPYLDDRDREDADFHGAVIVTEATSPAATPKPAEGGGDPATGPGAATSATIRMANRSFSPGTVTIAAGGSITFANDDDRSHTATGDSFDTGVLAPGGRSKKTFPSPGTFTFLCQIHPEMTGRISVTGSTGEAPPAAPNPTPRRTPVPPPALAPSTNGEAAPSSADVSIVDFAFQPAAIRVGVGGTVTWRNGGAAPHTVTAGDGSFDSGMVSAGGSFARTFTAPGTFAFACQFHPEMVGTVVVESGGGSAGGSSAGGSGGVAGQVPVVEPSQSDPGDGGAAGGSATQPAAAEPDGSATSGNPVAVASIGDGLVRLLVVAVIVAGAVIVFGVLVVNSARPGGTRTPR